MTNDKALICLVTCYYDTNYVRTTTLKESLSRSSYDFVHVANRSRGLSRYIEVIVDLIKTRFTKNPDAYFLTFRGYEILPIVRLITLGKPLVFDEFINPIELVVHEQKLVNNPWLAAIIRWGYRLWLKSAQAITTDTLSHAQYSADLINLPVSDYTVLPVGTDEKTFYPDGYEDLVEKSGKFQVFYYGSMLPLHGVEVVLEAMKILKDYDDIELLMVGGKDKAKQNIESARQVGARIEHRPWIEYDRLPIAMRKADVCLGGPFGDTIQAQYVITGKTYQQMSLGCPVIIGANYESGVFTDRHDALIVERGNPKHLADAMLWAYDNRDKLGEIGRSGRKLYQEKFAIDHLSEKIDNLFARVVKNR